MRREDFQVQSYLTCTINKAVLILDIHGLSFPKTTRPLHLDSPPVHLIASPFNLSNAVTKITPQRNVHRLLTTPATTRAAAGGLLQARYRRVRDESRTRRS